jgi:hypothetical protein
MAFSASELLSFISQLLLLTVDMPKKLHANRSLTLAAILVLRLFS